MATRLPAPPVAEQRPHSYTVHGITVEDPYHWLKDQSYPKVDDADVLAYLEAENAYFKAVMAPHKELTDTIFAEIKARQKPDDANVPVKDGHYFYQWRFEAEGQYRIWSRWPAADPGADQGPTAQAEVILDEPALAEGTEYFRLGALSVSNDGRLMAYSTDATGAERFTLRIKDLDTGELFGEVIENTSGSPVWSADDGSFFYAIVDENWRPYQVRRHLLGTPVEDDAIVYEEHDPGFFVGVSSTSSKRYVVVSSGDHVTSEAHLVPADAPASDPRLVAARREEHDYTVDHQGDRFVIRTNDTHKNNRLVTTPDDDPSEAAWETLLAGADERYITGFQAFADFVAVEERIDGLDQIRLLDRSGKSTHIEFPETAYRVGIGANEEFESRTLRLGYESMVTPDTVFDYDLDVAELRTRKVQEIPSGYDASAYATERTMAPARDGARVPVSIVYRKDTPKDGRAPLYLYGYGAYGSGMSPNFSTTRLSLLDRGFIYAIAHVRGGDELGYHWYEAGKLDRRTNTFNDFVDVARHLIAQGFTGEGRIAIAGGSAGGELMGAVINQAPELWGAAAAHVPFVDVLNTMLDTSLPLTPIEWPEWGNPIEDKTAFEYIRSYSPYDQLKAGGYPPILVTGGLNDPRVTYWEPAKYVAKLRTLKEDDNPLLLKTNMGAGHGGKSGRFDSLYEVAEEYTFMITSMTEDP
ncbi:MAG: S9 family peptidase [Gammaproteobacteria bacterium]|nr:S9 family peptidase [Gammaproteobacteria bacterium]